MEELRDKTVKLLNKLMQLNYDAQRTYTDADRVLDDSEMLSAYFKQQAALHKKYVEELRSELQENYIRPDQVSSFFDDTFDSLSMDLVTIVSGDDERVILKKCLQTVSNSFDEYQELVDTEGLPEDLCDTLVEQFKTLQQSAASLKEKIAAIDQGTEA